jgi:hypothetical protein
MYDVQHYVDLAEATEDIEELRGIISTLVDLVEDQQDEVDSWRVDPSRNQCLAQAVLAFAEWQTFGYEGDSHTRTVISRSLWHEVSTHVHHILGSCPDLFGADAEGVDASAA